MVAGKQTSGHGTTNRYRQGCRCDRCRSANAKAKSAQRARDRQRGSEPVLSLVGDVQDAGTSGAMPDERLSGSRALGRTERALEDDLKSVDQTTPFFRSLSSAVLVLARELDDLDSKGTKGPLVKQLVDTIREIMGKDVSNGNSFTDLLEGLAQPLVAPSPHRDSKKS